MALQRVIGVRVISGLAKGHKLNAPPGRFTRPTTDRVKENIFNILGPAPVGAAVLDLFAGSGALGIEALSRGARSAVFVERRPAAAKVIRENLVAVHLSAAAVVMTLTATKALNELIAAEKKFNLLFLDPPYKIKAAELSNILTKLANCVAPGGLVVLESGQWSAAGGVEIGLKLVTERRYGGTGIYIYKRTTAEASENL